MRGMILRGIGGLYTVRTPDGAEYALRAQSKLRHNRLKPVTGDIVTFLPGEGDGDGWIVGIEPRKNELIRPAVANIETLCVVVAASVPEPDWLLVDRLLIFCRMRGIRPILAVNKIEDAPGVAEEARACYAGAQTPVFGVSAKTGEGIEELRGALFGTVHCLGGQSGVGKSSLLNALYGFGVETGAISDRIDRGKNTTRVSELRVVEGGMALDTPGFSLLELPLMDPAEIRVWIPEYAPYEGKCRFQGCVHLYEPDCPARDAVARGEIDAGRHERYQILYVDMKARWRERYD